MNSARTKVNAAVMRDSNGQQPIVLAKERRPAVFLDRDGTLIEDRGHLRAPSAVAFFAETFGALRRLQKAFTLFIVTNQPGVAAGLLSLDDVERVNAHVVAQLAVHGARITATYVCPHRRADDCACIKPKPHFLHEAAVQFNIDLRRSFVVGDHPHDVWLARNAGATGIYVRTGHGLKHFSELPGDALVLGGIGDAADYILESVKRPPDGAATLRHAAGNQVGHAIARPDSPVTRGTREKGRPA